MESMLLNVHDYSSAKGAPLPLAGTIAGRVLPAAAPLGFPNPPAPMGGPMPPLPAPLPLLQHMPQQSVKWLYRQYSLEAHMLR